MDGAASLTGWNGIFMMLVEESPEPFTIPLSSQDPCIYAQDAVGCGDIWLSQTDLLIQY